MNPWNLTASELMIWGLVLHLIVDWPLQTNWLAKNKASLKHPAAYVHGFLHTWFLALIFGWVAIPLGIVHMLIDTRKPVVWWSKFMYQTQPQNHQVDLNYVSEHFGEYAKPEMVTLYDVGTEVRFWVDQVFHIVCIAIAALLVTL